MALIGGVYLAFRLKLNPVYDNNYVTLYKSFNLYFHTYKLGIIIPTQQVDMNSRK